MWKSVMDLGTCHRKASWWLAAGPIFCRRQAGSSSILTAHNPPPLSTPTKPGAAQLTGYEKKMYEARRIVELGGRVRGLGALAGSHWIRRRTRR